MCMSYIHQLNKKNMNWNLIVFKKNVTEVIIEKFQKSNFHPFSGFFVDTKNGIEGLWNQLKKIEWHWNKNFFEWCLMEKLSWKLLSILKLLDKINRTNLIKLWIQT